MIKESKISKQVLNKLLYNIIEIIQTEGWCQNTSVKTDVEIDHIDYDPYDYHPNIKCPRDIFAIIHVACIREFDYKNAIKNKSFIFNMIKKKVKTNIVTWNDDKETTEENIIEVISSFINRVTDITFISNSPSGSVIDIKSEFGDVVFYPTVMSYNTLKKFGHPKFSESEIQDILKVFESKEVQEEINYLHKK